MPSMGTQIACHSVTHQRLSIIQHHLHYSSEWLAPYTGTLLVPAPLSTWVFLSFIVRDRSHLSPPHTSRSTDRLCRCVTNSGCSYLFITQTEQSHFVQRRSSLYSALLQTRFVQCSRKSTTPVLFITSLHYSLLSNTAS